MKISGRKKGGLTVNSLECLVIQVTRIHAQPKTRLTTYENVMRVSQIRFNYCIFSNLKDAFRS